LHKFVSRLLILFLIITNTFINSTYAITYNTAEDAVNEANNFLDIKFQIPNYYKMTINKKNKTTISINSLLATSGTDAFYNKPVFVYGNNVEASEESTTNKRVKDENNEYRSLGYARDGSIFANPKFTADNDGYKANDKRWVSEPWGFMRQKVLYGEDGKIYDKPMSEGIYNYIKTWITSNMFYPDMLTLHLKDQNLSDAEKRKYYTSTAIDTPPVKNFEDCMYIIQPSTEHVWGLGIAFYYWTNNEGKEHLNYRTFRLKPFDMMKNDIYTKFEFVDPYLPSKKIEPGKKVVLGINVNSKDKKPINNVS